MTEIGLGLLTLCVIVLLITTFLQLRTNHIQQETIDSHTDSINHLNEAVRILVDDLNQRKKQ